MVVTLFIEQASGYVVIASAARQTMLKRGLDNNEAH